MLSDWLMVCAFAPLPPGSVIDIFPQRARVGLKKAMAGVNQVTRLGYSMLPFATSCWTDGSPIGTGSHTPSLQVPSDCANALPFAQSLGDAASCPTCATWCTVCVRGQRASLLHGIR